MGQPLNGTQARCSKSASSKGRQTPAQWLVVPPKYRKTGRIQREVRKTDDGSLVERLRLGVEPLAAALEDGDPERSFR